MSQEFRDYGDSFLLNGRIWEKDDRYRPILKSEMEPVLKEHFARIGASECPFCKNGEWDIIGFHHVKLSQRHDLFILNDNRPPGTLAMIAIRCKRCGFIADFDAEMVGFESNE